MGFADRSDSFDLNVALQDHFKYVEKSSELEKQEHVEEPKLDLGFKEGQTITINFGVCCLYSVSYKDLYRWKIAKMVHQQNSFVCEIQICF